MEIPLRSLTMALASLALCSCDLPPSAKKIANKFTDDHPGVVVLTVRTGEGDNDGMEYFIDYRLPPDPNPKTAQWLVHWGYFGGWGYSEDELEVKQ